MIAARMAFGNLFLHRAKSGLLGGIIALGIAVLFVGNSLIDTTVEGLRKMFVEGYTGNLMVTGPTRFPVTVLGETAGDEEVIPHIADFQTYAEALETDTEFAGRVAGYLPLLSGDVALGIGETVIGEGPAFGVNIADYRKFFSGNLTLLEGDWPEPGDSGWIVLSKDKADMLSAEAGSPVVPGSKIILSALGDVAGTVIREVTVRSVIRFNQSNGDLAQISLVDADTLRDLLGFASLRDGPLVLTESQKDFVEAFDPDSLFGEDVFGAVSDNVAESHNVIVSHNDTGTVVVDPEPAWQFILVKTVSDKDAGAVMAALEKRALTLDRGDRVQDWVEGAGSVARTARTVRLVFDLMVSVVAIIVIMITMNVLVVSIGERIPEIGTLRALGARKKFVRKLIFLETAFLAGISGAIGLAVGLAILLILGKSGIQAPNLFFEALFAGRTLVPRIGLGAAIRAFLWIFGMSVLSSIYPTALALKVKPVVAMQGD